MGRRMAWRVDLEQGLAFGPDKLLVAFSRLPGDPDFTVRIEATDGRDLTLRQITQIAEEVSDAVRDALQNRSLH